MQDHPDSQKPQGDGLRLGSLRTSSPFVRGSWYCLGYWGITGAYLNFLNVFFHEINLSVGQIGVLSALGPLLAITLAPWLA